MKKEQRQVFIELAAAVNWTICSFCRYSWSEGSICSDTGFLECQHPIEIIGESFNDGNMSDAGEDCWGFRPSVNASTVADIVGTILSESLDPEKVQWYSPDPELGGKIKVEGFKLKSEVANDNPI